MGTGRPNHRPRRNTPDQLADAVEQAIKDYENSGDVTKLHDIHLLEILGNISMKTLERYYDGSADRELLKDIPVTDDTRDNNNISSSNSGDEYTKKTYGEALKKLIGYRQMVCLAHLTADRFNAGWIFLSKQPHWGGFQDVQRTETRGKQEISVTIQGADGKALRE